MWKPKAAFLTILFLTCFLALPLISVHADGVATSYSFSVEGAKMVSEDGYFWFQVSLVDAPSIPHQITEINFSLNFSPNFTLYKTFLGFVGTNWAINYSSDVHLLFFSIPDNGPADQLPTNDADLLFFAPSLQSNESYHTYTFHFQRLDTAETLFFNVEVVNLKTFDPSINPLYGELQKENDFLNMKISAVLNATGFDWTRYTNDPSYHFLKASSFDFLTWNIVTIIVGLVMFLVGIYTTSLLNRLECEKGEEKRCTIDCFL